MNRKEEDERNGLSKYQSRDDRKMIQGWHVKQEITKVLKGEFDLWPMNGEVSHKNREEN